MIIEKHWRGVTTRAVCDYFWDEVNKYDSKEASKAIMIENNTKQSFYIPPSLTYFQIICFNNPPLLPPFVPLLGNATCGGNIKILFDQYLPRGRVLIDNVDRRDSASVSH